MEIERMRKEKGFSRYKLAKLSGLKNSTLQNIENDSDPNPTFKTMCRIADALEISLDDLRRK